MGRSCINVVGNTTKVQNIGSGFDIYAGKSGTGALQFKGMGVSGTGIKITCDDDTVYFSAQTGAGSGTVTSASNGLTTDGTTVCLGGTLSNATEICGNSNTLSFPDLSGMAVTGTSFFAFRVCSTSGNACSIQLDAQTSTVKLIGCAGTWLAVGNGLTVSGGSTYFCSLDSGTQSNAVYIDGTGKLYCGAAGGGGTTISGTPGYFPLFNAAGDNIGNSHLISGTSCIGIYSKSNVSSLNSNNPSGVHAFNFGGTGACTCYLYLTYSTGSNSGPQINADTHTLRLRGSQGLFTFDNPLFINTNGTANTQMIIDDYGTYNNHQLTYVGGDGYDYGDYGYSIGLIGGDARSSGNCDGGDVVLKPGAGDGTGDTGRIIMDGLPACISETNILYIDALGKISSGATSGGGSGTVTSVAAGNGMAFTTITSTGSVTLGTPSTLTLTTTNSVGATTHCHALNIASFAGSSAGLVPTSVGGTTNFLRADGSWAAAGGGTVVWGSVGTSCITPISGCHIYLGAGECEICWIGGSKIVSCCSSGTWQDLCLYGTSEQWIRLHSGTTPPGNMYGADNHLFVDPTDATTCQYGIEFDVDHALGYSCIRGRLEDLHIGQKVRSTSGAGYDVCILGGCATFGDGGNIVLKPALNAITGNQGNLYMCYLPNTNGACTLHIASNVVSYYINASDSRLKCNLEVITGATSMLSTICGYSAEYNEISELSGTCEYVMLAQDVEPQLPLAVFNDVCANDETYKRIDYNQLIPVMWNIIKEQEARIVALESQ